MLGWLRGRKKEDPRAQLHAALGDFDLPSFPEAAGRVLRMLRDPDAAVGAIGDALSEDPGLSVKVLSLANSSAFGLRHPVRNVGHAVSLLGRSGVEPLVLAVVVSGALPNPRLAALDMRAFWKNAARRATCARGLADLLHPRTRSEAFSAALLSDMAVPLIAAAHGAAYAPVLQQWANDGGDLAALEGEALGFDHASIAGWVAQTWQFPVLLTDAIGAHHDGEAALEVGEARAVSVAALLDHGEEGRSRLIESVSERFGVPTDTVAAIVEASEAEAEEVAARMF